MKTARHLVATFIVAFFIVSTATVQSEDYRYETNNGSITITAYTGPGGDVVIPDKINGLPVTSIENYAFRYASLTSITIPDSVTSIGYGAFDGCGGLTSVTIPNSVTSIGGLAFESCTSLTGINVNTGNLNYSSVDGVLFDKNQTTLIEFPAGKPGSYIIPNSVISIGDGAFSGCAGPTSVTIPDSVTNIGDYAFGGCVSLTSITISAISFGFFLQVQLQHSGKEI